MPTSEIPLPQRKVGVGVTRVEFDVVRTLKPGEGVRFPCRWKHYVRRHKSTNLSGLGCAGLSNVRKIFRAENWNGVWNCKDGIVYAGRLQDGEN